VLTLHTGPQYTDDNIFDLSTMQPYNLKHIYDRFSAYVPDFVLFLPRSSDLNQLAKYAPDDKKLEVVHYCSNGSSKVKYMCQMLCVTLLTCSRLSAPILASSDFSDAKKHGEQAEQSSNQKAIQETCIDDQNVNPGCKVVNIDDRKGCPSMRRVKLRGLFSHLADCKSTRHNLIVC
jgi:hypothetical protein